MGCFYSVFSLPSSSILLPSHQNEGLISEKHFNTACPQTGLTVWTHAHKDESTHIQQRGSHAGEWRQITGSEERGNTDQNITEPSLPLQRGETTGQMRNEQCRAINQCCSCQLIKQSVWSQLQVNRGLQTLRGSGRGWRGWCCPYLSTALQRNTRLLPAGIHKVFQQQTSPHSLTPTLWETADGAQERNFKTNSTEDSLVPLIYTEVVSGPQVTNLFRERLITLVYKMGTLQITGGFPEPKSTFSHCLIVFYACQIHFESFQPLQLCKHANVEWQHTPASLLVKMAAKLRSIYLSNFSG